MTRSTDPRSILADLLSAPIDTADSDACAALLGDVKRVRGCVDAIEVRVSKRLRELHDTSNGVPVADEHARCGGVSADEGRMVSGTDRAPTRRVRLVRNGPVGA